MVVSRCLTESSMDALKLPDRQSVKINQIVGRSVALKMFDKQQHEYFQDMLEAQQNWCS